MDSNIIIAADFGNSKIALVAAEHTDSGQLQIIGVETTPTPPDSIRNGLIINASDVSFKLSELIKKLENRIKHTIKSFYVGINAHSLRTAPMAIGRNLNHAEVTQEILDLMRQEIEDNSTNERTILEIIPLEFLLDNERISTPIGAIGTQIIGNYLVASSKASVKDNLIKCMQRNIYDAIPRMAPMMVADAVMAESEKQLGCAVIDLGAGCTSVAVYKDSYLRHFAVIPLGGRHITQDIMHLNILEPLAEKLKKEKGCTLPSHIEQKLKITLPAPGIGLPQIEITNIQLAEIIEARQREIILFALNQIQKSGYADQLGAGILLTGGASQMLYLDLLTEELSGMMVRRASHTHLLKEDDDFCSRPEFSQIVGLLLNGTKNCCQPLQPIVTPEEPVQPVTPEKPVKKNGNKLFNKIGNGLVDLFSNESSM